MKLVIISKVNLSDKNLPDVNQLFELPNKNDNTTYTFDEDDAEAIIEKFFVSKRRKMYGIKYENRIVGMIGIYKEVKGDISIGFVFIRNSRKKESVKLR